MAQLLTEDEYNQQIANTIKNKTQDSSITPEQHAGLLENQSLNMYSGQMSAPRVLELSTGQTYSSKNHRGAYVIANLQSNQQWTFPDGLSNRDSLIIHNTSQFHDLGLSGVSGMFYNVSDNNSLVDFIGPGGVAWIFKRPNTVNFGIKGSELGYKGAFAFANLYPLITNITTTGMTYNVRVNRDSTLWYMGLPAGSPTPSNADIKAQTGAVFGEAGVALTASTNHTNNISGLTSDTAYDIYTIVEDGSTTLDNLLPDITTQPAASVGDIMVRDYQYITQDTPGYVWSSESGVGTTTFPLDVDMTSSSVLLGIRMFRGNTGRPTTSLKIGTKEMTKVRPLESPTNFPVYIDFFMMTKADAPANGNYTVEAVGPNVADYTQIFCFVTLEEAEQVILPSGQILTFEGDNVTENQLNFSGLPTSGYMLVNFAICRDEPEDTVFLDIPGDQNALHQGIDQTEVTTVASWKKGTAATNDMEVTDGYADKFCHLAVRVNPIIV